MKQAETGNSRLLTADDRRLLIELGERALSMGIRQPTAVGQVLDKLRKAPERGMSLTTRQQQAFFKALDAVSVQPDMFDGLPDGGWRTALEKIASR